MLHPDYPTAREVDGWVEELLASAEATRAEVRIEAMADGLQTGVRHGGENRYVRFSLADGTVYWGYWQPAAGGGPGPLLVHLPGYDAGMQAHPQLVARGFNVLHVNPRGYCAPWGLNEGLKRPMPKPIWPVMPETAASLGRFGYRDWLRDALVAVNWAKGLEQVQAERIGVFGTSQGGGGALLLGSVLRDRGVKAVAADLPYLINYPMFEHRRDKGAYHAPYDGLEIVKREQPEKLGEAWRGLGFVDVMSHAARLTMPVLLTASRTDRDTPAESIRSLFEVLPGIRSLTEFVDHRHGPTPELMGIAGGWFGEYV